MPDLQRVAIVTGASRGIGAAVAERLAHDGMAVVINYASNAALAEQLVGKIEAADDRAIACRADVADPAQARKLFDTAEQAFGGIDVLINNAGIMTLAPIATSDDALFDSHIAVNLKGTFNTLREAANRLRDGGRVVNFSTSVIGRRLPTYGVYVATKAAVEAMTSVLANELGPRGITVNAVAPGPIATEMFLADKTEQQIEQTKSVTPLRRLGEPEDIARVISFLVGPGGGWVNGQVVRANGGII
jgi:3-oxoacyl-[acyl-carrier protein] reductase